MESLFEMDDQCSSLFQLTNETAIYDAIEEVSLAYEEFFNYFLLITAPVLVLVNGFLIFILTRKELRTSYNIVFLFMALDQGLAIACRHLQMWQFLFDFGCSFTFTLPWVTFEMVITNFSRIFTAHVSWLAVIVTFVRLRHLGSPLVEPSMRLMLAACSSSFALIIVASVPLFLSTDIVWDEASTSCDSDDVEWKMMPFIVDSPLLFENDCLLLRILNISRGVLFNALPCALLAILSLSIAFRLRKIHKNHCEIVVGRSSATNADSKRSSLMIIMIVFTTLITDIPQAVINILVGVLSDRFRSSVMFGFTSLILILVMIASASNLAIHLCMSRRFREVTRNHICCLIVSSKIKGRKTTLRSSTRIPPNL